MEPKTARTVKWTGTILATLAMLVTLYSAHWSGPLRLIQILACVVLVAAILLQSGKGGGLSALGGMSDQSPFGARSSVALRNVSYFLAALFLLTNILLILLFKDIRNAPPAPAPSPISRNALPQTKPQAQQVPADKAPQTPQPQQKP